MVKTWTQTLERTQPVGRRTLLLFCVTTAVFVTCRVLVVRRESLESTVAATDGLVDEALLCNAVGLSVVVGGIFLGIGGLRPKHIGLLPAKLPVAVAATLGVWCVAQLVAAAIGLIRGDGVGLHPAWEGGRHLSVLGKLLGQLFGNALFEEIVYRGFLLAQLYLWFGGRRLGRSKARLAAAVLASSVFFALMHIPIRLHRGTAVEALPQNLAATVLIGVFFCWVYLQTGNLFVAVGVHALINTPTPLVAAEVEPQWVVFLLASAVLLFWPWAASKRGG